MFQTDIRINSFCGDNYLVHYMTGYATSHTILVLLLTCFVFFFGIEYSVVQVVDWVVPALDGFIGTIGTALFYVREFRDS